jgi:hypothetical protein
MSSSASPTTTSGPLVTRAPPRPRHPGR